MGAQQPCQLLAADYVGARGLGVRRLHAPERQEATGAPLKELASEAYLLLNPTNGFRESEVPTAPPAGFGHSASLS